MSLINMGMTEFVLLEGTDEKFAFDFPSNIPIGRAGVKLHGALKKLHAVMASNPGTMGYCALVDGIMHSWICTAIEAKKLHAENEALAKRIGELEHRLASLEQAVTNLSKGPWRA